MDGTHACSEGNSTTTAQSSLADICQFIFFRKDSGHMWTYFYMILHWLLIPTHTCIFHGAVTQWQREGYPGFQTETKEVELQNNFPDDLSPPCDLLPLWVKSDSILSVIHLVLLSLSLPLSLSLCECVCFQVVKRGPLVLYRYLRFIS